MNLATSIYGLCLLILLWHVFNGWGKGPARMLIKLFALAAAYVAGLLLGETAADLLKPLGYPQLVLLVLGRSAVALLAYFIVIVCGAILFKRTSQQELGLVRLFYGVTGAGIGLVFGLVMVWLMVVLIRVAGTLSPAPGLKTTEPTASTTLASVRQQSLRAIRAWKTELEDGPLNGVVKTVDPLREQDYDTADRVGVLLTEPERLRKFWDSPAMREWANDTKARELASDPEVQRLGREGNFAALLRHPKLAAYLDNPELLARARRTDFAAAVRDAVPEGRRGAGGER